MSLVSVITKKLNILLSLGMIFSASLLAASETYIVQKGDTLYSIGRKYGVTVDDIRKENNISANNTIYSGQKIIIPSNDAVPSPAVIRPVSKKNEGASDSDAAPKVEYAVSANVSGIDVSAKREYDVYTVQKGDTFYNISKVNDISIKELKALNNLSEECMLKTGQKLKIPVSRVDTDAAKLPDLPIKDPRQYSKKKGDSSLTWPVKTTDVVYTTGKVSGVQLAAKKDEPVKCIRAGIVMYTGNYRGYGNVVFVQAKAGYIYAYTGLGSIKVQKGDYVVFNDAIGTAGTDSIKGSSQMSLMVFLNSKPIDPAKAPRG